MGITCVEEIGVTHANLSALDTDVTWYPTENYIVVVINWLYRSLYLRRISWVMGLLRFQRSPKEESLAIVDTRLLTGTNQQRQSLTVNWVTGNTVTRNN